MLDTTNRRQRLPGVDVRPDAVKQARAESGLSLADVAGGRVTRAAIHLIETGRSRPSMPVLEMIAEKTGRPVSWFLAPGGRKSAADMEMEARVSELEHLAAAQDYARVRQLAEEMLQQPLGDAFEARVRYFLGRALVRLYEPGEALFHLARARAIFEALDDNWMVVECMDWTAGAMYLREDPGALGLQEDALRLCRTLDPVPIETEIRLLTNLAAVYTQRREWSKAIKLYEQVVDRGQDMQDMGRLARVYAGLGLAYRNLGDMTRAVTYTQRAATFQSLQHDKAALAKVEVELAVLLMRHGDHVNAEKHLATALESCLQNNLEDQRDRVLLRMAELHLDRGDGDRARREAHEATLQAERDDRLATAGEGHAVLGRIRAAGADHDGADREFGKALRIFGRLNEPERLVETHHAYAQVLKDRGDAAAAYQQLEAAITITRPGLSTPASKTATREVSGTA
ncbi:MAG TPA: helix-turn-helix domain-containing protein [Candidatus Dormibacteraeota bacterium]